MAAPARFSRLVKTLALLFLANLGGLGAGCSSLTSTHATPTSQTVCADFDSGQNRCGEDFDGDACVADLSCQLALYRSEAIDLVLHCADRFQIGLCPSLSGYFCEDDREQLKKLQDPTQPQTAAAREFLSAFEAKQASCKLEGITVPTRLHDVGYLLRERIFTETRPCLNTACSDIALCLTTATSRVAPFCP